MEKTNTFIPDGNGYYTNVVPVQRIADKRAFPPFTCHCKEEEKKDFAAIEAEEK